MNHQNSSSVKLLKEFAPQLEKTSKWGYLLFAILIICFGLGVYALVVQIVEGHIVTGMRDNVVWGIYIVNFIFFIGISYAGALISGILHLLRVEWRKPIIRIAEIITVVSTLIGPTFIILCIGRLDRLHHLFLYSRIQSPITWDVIAILTYLSGSIIFLYLAFISDYALLRDNPLKVGKWRRPIYKFLAAGYKGTPRQKKILRRSLDIMSIIIIPLAVLVHSVLSWIFGMTTRPGWHSTIFAPYFVVAAVYSGTGVLIIAMWIFRKAYKLEKYITKVHFNFLGILLMILGALYGYFTFSEYLTSWYGSEKWELHLIYKLFDFKEYGWWFFFSAFVGVFLPIIIIGIPRIRNIHTITFGAIIAVVALWMKRYIIIIPTLETPLLPMQDIRTEWVSYSATWVEWVLTLAGVSTFILLFYIISKFIPIVPVSEMTESDEEKDDG